ncbi:RHS Repeat family protein [Striga asiatica]|uniref:RHS Repeat family protein n=1 Tax=Striga asiatica TaxID=4170 RepID=A0A5A7PAF3_STRAF|nr:RHS Repeat family protein [Striga asiatica]
MSYSSTTCPNTTCLSSSHFFLVVQMKKCVSFVPDQPSPSTGPDVLSHDDLGVLVGLRDDVGEELHHDSAAGLAANRYVEIKFTDKRIKRDKRKVWHMEDDNYSK